jgi:hypothetical protein
MKHKECNKIRLEIDESELGANLSPTTVQHLRECAECQEFQNRQTKLRQIIGSLETVTAPADFDFRLRARLANGEKQSGYQFLSSFPMMRSAGFVVAVLILLVIGAYAFLRVSVPREQLVAETPAAPTEKSSASVKEPEAPPKSVELAGSKSNTTNESVAVDSAIPLRRSVGSAPRPRRAMATIDSSGMSAPVIRINQPVAGMTTFPLEIPQESFKVSIDDGRGTSRTISLPGFSFGSRRVLTGRNVSHQFGQNGVW